MVWLVDFTGCARISRRLCDEISAFVDQVSQALPCRRTSQILAPHLVSSSCVALSYCSLLVHAGARIMTIRARVLHEGRLDLAATIATANRL